MSGTTTPWGIEYPTEGDEVNVHGDVQRLAEDVRDALGHALAIADAAARPSSPTRGLIVQQDDDDQFYGFNGSIWVPLSGSGGGGGGGSGDGGRWHAGSTAQNIPATVSGPGTIVAFGTAAGSPDPVGVTREVEGAGHAFEVGSDGIWGGQLIARYAANSASGVRDFSIWCDRAGGTSYAEALTGPQPQTVAGQAKGGTYPFRRWLPAGTRIVCYAFNGTGGTRALEPSGGNWVSFELWQG
jgi:hypothetical protein